MSNYRGKEFLGFGTSAPPNIIPGWLYRLLIFPAVKNRHGVPVEAPYGLRKLEAKLLQQGLDVLTVDPDHLKDFIGDADVLGVHTMDPFGLGPSSTTFSRILNTGEPYLASCFRAIFENPEVGKAKQRGLKVFVGGPGAWQFRVRDRFQHEYGIDFVIEGEADAIIGDFVRKALRGESLPKFYEVDYDDVPRIEDIADIKNPSINGLVEIGRGCPRGCRFCSVTLRPLRWYPFEKIEKELSVNSKARLKGGILHAEDVLLYGSETTIPNREKVLKLHRLAKKYVPNFSWSHSSMAAIATDAPLIEEISNLMLDENQRWWGAQIGIETGSPRLLRRAMPAKAHPFKPEEWPDVVKTAAGVMTDNGLFPACTLITGLPEEEDSDVIATIELIDDLEDFQSLIVPLFFVPLGRLKDEDWFKFEDVRDLQRELMIKCLQHDLRWARRLMDRYFEDKKFGWFYKDAFNLFVWLLERRAKRECVLV